MKTQETAIRFDRAVELAATDGLLEILRIGDDIVINTGEGLARRTRRGIRALCLLAAFGGFGLLAVSPWGLAVAALALAASYLAPRLIRQACLLQIDPIRLVASPRHAVASPRAIDLAGVASIEGVYETQGWDPRIVIYFVRRAGGRVEGVVFTSGNDAAARCCCGVLSRLLDVPATYTNQYAATEAC